MFIYCGKSGEYSTIYIPENERRSEWNCDLKQWFSKYGVNPEGCGSFYYFFFYVLFVCFHDIMMG